MVRAAEGAGKAHDPNALKDVVLSLDGKSHDLSIGYVAETPVWRPSYRVVVQEGNQADLQTWGIVQNLSGEAWSNVDLVLVAGAPIAFQSTLGNPVIPDRPVVNDSGEVIAAVPTGETSLAEAPAEAASAPPRPRRWCEPVEAEMDADGGQRCDAEPRDDGDDERQSRRTVGVGAARWLKPKSAPCSAAAGTRLMMAPIMAQKQWCGVVQRAAARMSALAAVALEAGTTRYSLPDRVTVPDQSATMVLLLHERVPGAAVFLFSPDPGVPDSYSHPFRVVRFTNASKGLLERGPIAVFEKGSFLGEGVLEPLPPKATATVPFALERGVAVESESRFEELGARVMKIESGALFIERDQVHKTIYKAKNGGGDASHLLVKHPRSPGARLFQPPPGTEDNVTGTGAARSIPAGRPALRDRGLLRRGRTKSVSTTSRLAEQISPPSRYRMAYLADTRSDPKIVVPLTRRPWVSPRQACVALNDDRVNAA